MLEPYAPKGARAVLRGGVASRGAPLTRLGLELTDPGFDFSVLCEVRARLVAGGAEHLLLDALLAACRARGYLKARGRQRTDSTHVLAAVRALNRVELVTETMRHALTVLAALAPEWLRAHGRPPTS